MENVSSKEQFEKRKKKGDLLENLFESLLNFSGIDWIKPGIENSPMSDQARAYLKDNNSKWLNFFRHAPDFMILNKKEVIFCECKNTQIFEHSLLKELTKLHKYGAKIYLIVSWLNEDNVYIISSGNYDGYIFPFCFHSTICPITNYQIPLSDDRKIRYVSKLEDDIKYSVLQVQRSKGVYPEEYLRIDKNIVKEKGEILNYKNIKMYLG